MSVLTAVIPSVLLALLAGWRLKNEERARERRDVRRLLRDLTGGWSASILKLVEGVETLDISTEHLFDSDVAPQVVGFDETVPDV